MKRFSIIILMLLLVIALVGCGKTEKKNILTGNIVTNTQIKGEDLFKAPECKPIIINQTCAPCQCNCQTAVCPEPKVIYVNVTHNVDSGSAQKLTDCNYDKQRIFREYQSCLAQNNSATNENLKVNLTDMTRKFQNCSYRLNNISRWLR